MAATAQHSLEPDHAIAGSRYPFAITPHDSNELARDVKAIYVGVTGNITLRTRQGGADVLFSNVLAGSILPVRAAYVRATGTTASGLVGLA